MARRAVRDTYALEPVGPDTHVRRQVVAGSDIPDHWTEFEDPGAIEDVDAPAHPGPQYKHQRGVPVEVQEQRAKDRASRGRRRSRGPDGTEADFGGDTGVREADHTIPGQSFARSGEGDESE